MQLNGISVSLFFALLTQQILCFSEPTFVERLDNQAMFVNINSAQAINGITAAQAFVQTARNAGAPDSEIITELINTLDLEKEKAYSTTSYSLKNDVNHVWFFLGAMAMLGVISVGYLIYWLVQKKQNDPVVPPPSIASGDQRKCAEAKKSKDAESQAGGAISSEDGLKDVVDAVVRDAVVKIKEKVIAQEKEKLVKA